MSRLHVPARTVTYRAPAQTASRLLGDVSKRYSAPLSADAATGGEVLLVSVRRMPLEGLMRRIADVTFGEWRPNGKGFRLVSSDAALRRNEAELQAARVAYLHKVIGELENGRDPGDIIFSDNEQPGATKLLIAIGAERLAAVPPQERVVWATAHPTATQRKLDGDFGPIFKQWIDGYNATVREWQEMTKGTNSMKRDLIEEPIDKATVAVTGSYAEPYVEICAFGTKGQILMPPITVHIDEFQTPDDVNVANEKPAIRKAPIKPSAKTKLADRAYREGEQGSKLPPYAARKVAATAEPLGLFTSDVYLSVAAAHRRDLVANLPDGSMIPVFGDEPNAETVGELFDQVYGGHLAQRDDGECLVMKPVSARQCRRERTPRGALRRLANLDARTGWASLDEIAAFVLSIPEPETWFLDYCQTVMLPELPQPNDEDLADFKVYGALSPAQRATLWKGGEIAYRDLTPIQAGLVKNRLFADTGGAPGDPRKVEPLMDVALNLSYSVFDNREPTQLMPNGLPENGALIGTPGSEPALRFVDAEGRRLPWIASAKDLTYNRVTGPEDSFPGGTTWHPMDWPARAILGSRRRLRLTYTMAPNVFERGAVTDYREPKGAARVATKRLPAGLQKVVDAYVHASGRGKT